MASKQRKTKPQSRPAGHPSHPTHPSASDALRGDSYTTTTVALVLATITLVVYLPSLGNQLLNWDDTVYVTENAHIRQGLSVETIVWAFRSGEAANWHPLTWLSHALDVQLWGAGQDGAWGHHLTSILLHALNAGLLLVVLHRLTGRLWPSAVVAALFALHPLHVESVSWVAERKDLLCGTFTFLTLWAYASYAAQPSLRRYLLVALAFAAALMSKPMAVTVPFVLLLLDLWPLKRLSWRSVAEKLPLVAMTVASSVVTFLVQQQGRAVRDLDALPVAQRLANASYAYVMYLVKTFCPWPGSLVPLYPLADRGGPLIGAAAAAGFAAVLLAITVAAVVLWRRRRPQVLVGWLVYAGMLVPVIGLVQVGKQIMADRYTYLPLVGVFVAVVWLVLDWAASRPGRLRAAGAVAVVVLAILGGLTVRQQRVWSDSISFWECNTAAWPNNGVAWDSLANALWELAKDPERTNQQRQNVARAIAAQRRAVEAKADDCNALSNLGDKLFAAGKRYNDASLLAEAERSYRKAVECDEEYYPAEVGLGNIAMLHSRFDEALEHYSRAASLNDELVAAHFNLGRVHHAKGELDDAIREYKRALELNPELADACRGIAVALVAQGKPDEARTWQRRADEIERGRE